MKVLAVTMLLLLVRIKGLLMLALKVKSGIQLKTQ